MPQKPSNYGVNIGIEQFFTTIINRKKWGVFQYIVDLIRFNVEITFFTRKSPFYWEITFFTEVNKAISKVNKVIFKLKNYSIPIFTMNNPPFLLIYHFSGGVKMVNKEKWGGFLYLQ